MKMANILFRFGFLIPYIGFLGIGQYLSDRTWLPIVFVVVGALLGYVLPLFIDAWMPILVKTDRQNLSASVQATMDRSLEVVKREHVASEHDQRSVFRSYVFLAAYGATAIFILSSTNSPFAEGVVLGLGLSLMQDLYIHRHPAAVLRQRWFAVFPSALRDDELSWFVWGSIVGFGILSVIGFFV